MPITTNPVTSDAPAVDASVLLPTRAELIERLADHVPVAAQRPATLVIVGLLRRDDSWPIPGSVLGRLTQLFAGSIRGDDWLARSGPTEFAFLLNGPGSAAGAAATRLVAAVSAEGIPGMSAAAGVAALTPDTTAGELHRRATLCLAAARSIGGGQVITYSGSR